MAGAIIVIDQPAGAGAGSPGVARNDLWQSRQINLSVGTGGNTVFQWDLLDKPPGSAASLTGATTSTPSFTPDLSGTYRIQLITNGGGPGNIQILVARVRFTNVGALLNRGHALPGYGESAGEANYGGNTRGWAPTMEFIEADTLSIVLGGGAAMTGDVTGTTGANVVHGLTHVTSDLTFSQAADVAITVAPAAVPGDGNDLTVTGGKSGNLAGVPGQVFVKGAPGFSGTGIAAAGAGGAVYVTAGDGGPDGGGGGGAGGLLGLDAGDGSAAAANGSIVIGGTNADAVSLGRVGKTVTALGSFAVIASFTVDAKKPFLLPQLIVYPGIAGAQMTGQASTELGAISFDPSALFAGNAQITRTIRFVAVLECAIGGQVGTLELYNITDGGTVVSVNTSATSPTRVVSATLTVPGNLPNSLKLYGLRLKRTSGGAVTDLITCKLAQLEVLYT